MAEPRPAAPPRRFRARYAVAGVVCAGAVVWMLGVALRENVVYLRPVSEAVARREEQGTKRFRIGGEVVAGSVRETADGVRFEMTDGEATVAVAHAGDPPDLFDEGAPVVCEGRWDGDTFASDRLLIRHGSEYRPPDVGGEGGG